VCGPTGGSLPGAASDTKWLEQERSVISFLAEQREAAEKHGWLLVALGDMNSVADIKLDTWGGTHTVRTECLAMALQDGGMTDTFRCAHPDARAFTYFHETASASRLDQVWYWAPLSVEVLICTAAVIWGWARKADHDPSVADLSMSLPDAEVEEVPVARQWRKIVRLTDEGRGDELCQQVHAAVAKRSTSMEAVGARLSQVRSELRLAKLEKAAAGACLPGYVEGMLPWVPPTDPRSTKLTQELSQAFGELQELLLQCLPCPPADGNKTRSRGTAAWVDCARHLRAAKTILKEEGRKAGGLARRPPVIDFREAQKAWDMGVSVLRKMQVARAGFVEDVAAGSVLDWDAFHTDPFSWAQRCGFAQPTSTIWTALPRPNRDSIQDSEGLGALQLGWSGMAPERLHIRDCMVDVSAWIQAVDAAGSKVRSWGFADFYGRRRKMLRDGDIRGWAQLMRPPSTLASGYVPESVTLEDGTSKAPTSPREVLLGTTQTWARLLREPENGWMHASVREWRDNLHCRRG
jgi:hypothetical protein